MRKIIFSIIWIGCIVLLSITYDNYLWSEFRLETINGVVMDKGTDKNIQNTFDRFTEEKVYWIKLDKEKIKVTKSIYNKVEPEMEIRINRTRHGMTIE